MGYKTIPNQISFYIINQIACQMVNSLNWLFVMDIEVMFKTCSFPFCNLYHGLLQY